MAFRSLPGDTLTISDITYIFLEHPVSPGMAYGQSGRRGTVYQLSSEDNTLWALKVFLKQYREPRLAGQAEQMAAYADLPGLQACRRTVLSASRHLKLLHEYPDLDYAVLMPWIQGRTWVEITIDKEVLTPEESLDRARSLASVLLSMEERSLAHCDLSGPNLILPPKSGVELIDLEEMYGTQLVKPEMMPGGSPGYAHKTAPQGLWNPRADRFSGAVLLAEMLGWAFPAFRAAAWGEGFFDPDEMGTNCERYRLLQDILRRYWGDRIADAFSEAWFSDTLSQCPTFSQWMSSLPLEVPPLDFFTSAQSSTTAVPSSEAGFPGQEKDIRIEDSYREKDTRACPVCNQQVEKDITVCPFCESILESVLIPRQDPEPAGLSAGETASEPEAPGRRPWWIAAVAAVIVIVSVLFLTGVFGSDKDKQPATILDPSITQFIAATASPSSSQVVRNTTVPATQPSESSYQVIPTVTMPEELPDYVMYLRINPVQSPLDDLSVRRALAYALDKDLLAQDITNEIGVSVRPASSLTVPEVLGIDAAGYIGYDFQPDTARVLLAAAGYDDGAGFQEIVMLRYPSQTYTVLTDLVLSMWQDTLGLTITAADADTHESLINAPVALISWSADYPDPYSFLHDAICGSYSPDYYGTQESDQVFEDILSTSNWAERAVAVRAFSTGVCGSIWNPPLTGQFPEYANYLDFGLTHQDSEERMNAYLHAEKILVDQHVVIIPLLYWEVGQTMDGE